jgi:hypothetical protein
MAALKLKQMHADAVLDLLVSSNYVTRAPKVLVSTQPVKNFPACCGIQRLISTPIGTRRWILS